MAMAFSLAENVLDSGQVIYFAFDDFIEFPEI
jgi:hypothetical protein